MGYLYPTLQPSNRGSSVQKNHSGEPHQQAWGVEKAKALYRTLIENQIPIDPVSQTSNVASSYYDSISQHGFAGEDCTRLLVIFPQLLEIIFPTAERQHASRSDIVKIDGYHQVWQYWASFLWPLINSKVTAENKGRKAASVKTQAAVFCSLWNDSFGSSQILYLHLLSVHLPEQIENFPVDPLYFSLQGLEHANKKRKQHKELSNCHKTTKTVTISAYVKADGTSYKEHERSTGPTMVVQLLKMTTLDGIIEDGFIGQKGKQDALEAARVAKYTNFTSILKTCKQITL